MEVKVKMSNIQSLQGQVTSVLQRSADCIIFNLRVDTSKIYKIICPFFCPVKDEDIVYIAQCRMTEQLTYKCLTQPFVSIQDSEEVVIKQLLSYLAGSGFGIVSAKRLYNHLVELSQQLDIQPTELISNPVVVLLDKLSEKYNETRSEKIIEMIISTQEKNTGIRGEQPKNLLLKWYQSRSLRKLYLLGLTKKEIKQSQMNIETMYEICITNPYRIPGVEYDKCENIMRSMNREASQEMLICGRINRFIYRMIHDQDNTCVHLNTLRGQFPQIDSYLTLLQDQYFIKVYEDYVYFSKTFEIETQVISFINQLITDTAEIENIEAKNGVVQLPTLGNRYTCSTLTDEQKTAVEAALKHKISIITGSAGTGKSLIIREIVDNLKKRGMKYYAVGFTGKSVSRLHNIISREDSHTIDRLIIGLHKEVYDLPDHIIIDEASMVTTELFFRLIKALEALSPKNKLNYSNGSNNYQSNCSITFIGDCNQLPPIGWGNLMRGLMESRRIPTYYLTRCYRIESLDATSGDKFILENANTLVDKTRDIRKPMTFKQGNGFHIVPGDKTTVKRIITGLYKANYDLDKILILSPFRNDLPDLNQIVQDVYLSNMASKMFSSLIRYHINDRIMMTRNDYDVNIMNGEEGKIVDIDETDAIKVEFKDSIHTFKFSVPGEDKDDNFEDVFDFKEMNEKAVPIESPKNTKQAGPKGQQRPLTTADLVHSYAVSIHKSQGSEADYVILYIPANRVAGNFLNINLLYTAMTRAKKTLWVVTSEEALKKIASTPLIYKVDTLSIRLKSNKNDDLEKNLEVYTIPPSFMVSSSFPTGLTFTPDEDYDADDIDLYEYYADEIRDM